MDDSGGRNTTVSYCCVWKDGQVLHKYTTGNRDTDDLAALCLQSIPPHHRSYFQTVASYTFAFLIDDGFVYFAILRHSLGNSYLLSFLHKLRDELNKMGSTSTADDQFLPVVRRLVASLERVSQGGGAAMAWPPMNGNAEAGTSSTKAPLLARPSKLDKKNKKKKNNNKDIDVVRDIETPDHRLRSSDIQETSSSAPPSHKDYNSSSKIKTSKQIQREKWCRQVRIVLAIDAAVCILLLVIWLVICRGIECIR